jgi:2-polyprenyl-3-methyl-5-hydroxy-6-metoxy-1,4-benzoquinol methylase
LKKDKRNIGAIDYFHRNIRDFDGIYGNKGGFIGFLNRIIRASVKARFNLTFDILGDLKGRAVLDVGCGSGRYMFESLAKGASKVMGLDAAEGALNFARDQASRLKVADQVGFHHSDFLDFDPGRKFDVILAIGYYDYVFDPLAHLKRMVELSDGLIIASFPRLWSIWTPLRKVRLALNRCPVRFYTQRNIVNLMKKVGNPNFEIKTIFRDNILIIRK